MSAFGPRADPWPTGHRCWLSANSERCLDALPGDKPHYADAHRHQDRNVYLAEALGGELSAAAAPQMAMAILGQWESNAGDRSADAQIRLVANFLTREEGHDRTHDPRSTSDSRGSALVQHRCVRLQWPERRNHDSHARPEDIHPAAPRAVPKRAGRDPCDATIAS